MPLLEELMTEELRTNFITVIQGYKIALEEATREGNLREPLFTPNNAITILRAYAAAHPEMPDEQSMYIPMIEEVFLTFRDAEQPVNIIGMLNQMLVILNPPEIQIIDNDINNLNNDNINELNNFIINNNDNINDLNNFDNDGIDRERAITINNQTVHDVITEATIQESITRLKDRYGIQESTLSELIEYLNKQANNLLESGHLNLDEINVIKANFDNLLHNIDVDEQSKAKDLLSLAIQALNDKESAHKMLGRTSSEQDDQDRWSGWFKSAIVDSQLAYRRDRGDTTFPSVEELNNDRSCFGGGLNRIISALNFIHPDVVIEAGQGALANMQQYREVRDKAKIKKFGQDLPDAQQELVKHYLATFSLPTLEAILSELNKLDVMEESTEKSQVLTTFEKDLEERIISAAKSFLDVEDVDLIEKELKPFISAYISGILQGEIQVTIANLKSQYISSPRKMSM